MSQCEDYNFVKPSCGLWRCMTMYHVVSRLDNNSLRGGVGHSELQRYHEVSALNLFRSFCRGASSDLSDKETDCVAVKSKDSVLTVCEVSRLDKQLTDTAGWGDHLRGPPLTRILQTAVCNSS